MEKKIKVLIKRVGEPPIVQEIKNNPKVIRKLLGTEPTYGWYSEMPVAWIAHICPYGATEDLQPNVRVTHETIYGDFIAVSADDEGNNASLTSDEIRELMIFILCNEIMDDETTDGDSDIDAQTDNFIAEDYEINGYLS